jgi:outer membrane immunogenic protein
MRQKFSLLTISLMAILVHVAAQREGPGIKLGLNSANASANIAGAYFQSITDFHFGLLYTRNVAKNLSVQPQLVYNRVGTKVLFDTSGSTEFNEYRFDVLDLPVYLMYNFSIAKNTKLQVAFGPQLSFVMLGSVKNNYGNSKAILIDDAGGVLRHAVSLNAMMNVEFAPGLFVGANYSWGVSNWTNETNKWRSNVLAFSLGWMFGKQE